MTEPATRSRDRRLVAACLGLVIAASAAAGGASWWLLGPRGRPEGRSRPPVEADAVSSESANYLVDNALIDDGGFAEASRFTGEIRDPTSLDDLRRALAARGPAGIAAIGEALERAASNSDKSEKEAADEAGLLKSMGLLLMYEGRFEEADAKFAAVSAMARSRRFPSWVGGQMTLLRGVVALRRGEVDNCIECLGPSSCTFPIVPEATHTRPSGSRDAIGHFSAYLVEHPGDLRARWLLNLAYMTLGENPSKVPAKYLIPARIFRSRADVGRFVNEGSEAGLNVRGPNQAGGAIFDDFNGDGRPDLFMTSLDVDRGASLFINKGGGTFEDRSKEAGLDAQIYALNVARTDYDNDGDLDVLLLRGAWEKPMRMSLLRNKGDGKFDDVTLAAGLGEPISSEAAAWGDYDNDGLVDLYVCGEYSNTSLDKRNLGRLYRNKGDGTFENVAEAAGVLNMGIGKGCAWGDYDGDGQLDLLVSNRTGACRLYRNLGDGKFHDEAPALGVTGAHRSFACGFWDYDNDGRLDLLISDLSLTLAEDVALTLDQPIDHPSGPRIYRNLGAAGFRDVTADLGLDPAISAMGVNFGDIDNDGDLDLYFGTGGMSYSYLVPNRLFENVSGEKFEDVTTSSGTGHLQKGHGVSFADYDDDGALDFFVEAGGGVPGDRSFNLLYRNPGHASASVKVKLVGTKTNRAALGARLHAIVEGKGGARRAIFRTVGNNMSFGGNTLVETLGLAGADSLAVLEVSWPTSGTTQTFRDIPAGSSIEITEGRDAIRTVRPPKRHD
jgi:FG-GAP-like repeat/ASPIC and UnbV